MNTQDLANCMLNKRIKSHFIHKTYQVSLDVCSFCFWRLIKSRVTTYLWNPRNLWKMPEIKKLLLKMTQLSKEQNWKFVLLVFFFQKLLLSEIFMKYFPEIALFFMEKDSKYPQNSVLNFQWPPWSWSFPSNY